LEPPPEAPCQRISIHLPDVVAYGAGAGALVAPSGSARRLLLAMGRDASCDKAGAGGGDPASLEAIIAALREQNTAQQAVIACEWRPG
jgi:hypothetical protein